MAAAEGEVLCCPDRYTCDRARRRSAENERWRRKRRKENDMALSLLLPHSLLLSLLRVASGWTLGWII